MDKPRFENHLARETSPYLLQHAHNPVDWYPWGDEALAKARSEDRPILLSIGYSACHWCHVMEHESFENTEIARLMNDNFVNVKVDREERPDLDQIYMSAVQLMTGSGGWPLTVFLTPEMEPFYGGTYFPPDDRYGRPGFGRVLASISEAYHQRRDDISSSARAVIERINSQATRDSADGGLDLEMLDQSYRQIASRFDSRNGGFGSAPKFPPSMVIDFLFRYHIRNGHERALEMSTLTLDRMASGGIYDQVGGGFHRYSTDDHWLVPHFEKMLYDNALLVRAYLDGYRITGRETYRRVVEETLDFVSNEMRDAGGGFYSTQDADSEGVEGKFYVWDLEEFSEVVGESSELLARFFDVTEAGNFEQRNILQIRRPANQFADLEGLPEEELKQAIFAARKRLFERREGRPRPGRDEKILTDWNGLMLRAYAEAAAYLDRDDYRAVAETNAEFLISTMWDGHRLLHSFKDGAPRFNAYLDDYANLSDGLLALYQLTFDERWLDRSVELVDRMIDQFWDREHGGFYFTANEHEALIARTKEYFDNATPSGNSVAADVLTRLAALLDRTDYRDKAEQVCRSVGDYVRQFPSGLGRMLAAVDFIVGPSQEIALIGPPNEFLPVVRKYYLPRSVAAAGASERIALLRDRPAIDGKATAYVCENYACKQPATDPAALDAQLKQL